MMRMQVVRVIPISILPGDWCFICMDPEHAGKVCNLLEYKGMEDGTVAVEPCGCDNSVTANQPDRYVVRVTQMQFE